MNIREKLKATRTRPSVMRLTRAMPPIVFEPLKAAWNTIVTEKLSTAPAVFDNRAKGRNTLLLILAGYKPELWNHTLTRIAKHTANEQADLCVVCPGDPPAAARLRELSAQYGWSFLQSHEDKLAHTQNLAVAAFPNVEWLAKLDEDMFVTAQWLEMLRGTYEHAERDGRYKVGFAAPLIPINGFGYRLMLELTGQLDEYIERFPNNPPVSASHFIGVHESPEIGEWLWRRTAPIDQRASELAANNGGYSVCPHRFSIGAILMKRATWVELGGFTVADHGILGVEESELCKWCMEHSRAIVVSHSSLVGHFSFFPQWEHMVQLLEKEPALFA